MGPPPHQTKTAIQRVPAPPPRCCWLQALFLFPGDPKPLSRATSAKATPRPTCVFVGGAVSNPWSRGKNTPAAVVRTSKEINEV